MVTTSVCPNGPRVMDYFQCHLHSAAFRPKPGLLSHRVYISRSRALPSTDRYLVSWLQSPTALCTTDLVCLGACGPNLKCSWDISQMSLCDAWGRPTEKG